MFLTTLSPRYGRDGDDEQQWRSEHRSPSVGVEAVILLRPAPSPISSPRLPGAEREALCASYYCRCGLLIVDEIGYLPVTPGGYHLFFELVNARYEKSYNPNLETRLFRLGEIFGDCRRYRAPRSPPAPRRRHPNRGLELSPTRSRRSRARGNPPQNADHRLPHSGDAATPRADHRKRRRWIDG